MASDRRTKSLRQLARNQGNGTFYHKLDRNEFSKTIHRLVININYISPNTTCDIRAECETQQLGYKIRIYY